ncbi:App1 family protein [Arthrobacter halodurans]|uniref:App1 family protein n=1 Tax=Arthrobacter halodurans TaxID=516699 RepID=A0ABV4UR66_9MICC
MRLPETELSRFRQAAVTAAYRMETGIRDRLARRAAERGWTPAVIPYSGYAGADHARVLGRVVLAPASVDPAARRGISGWRRLLTLESPGTDVEIELGGTTTTATSDSAGIIDARLPLDSPLEPGTATALLRTDGRDPVPANVHAISPDPARGVVCDIDDTVWVTGIAHPLRAAWRTLRGSSSTRRSVPGMARLLRTAVEGQDHPGVVYLSNGPWNFVGPVTRFLERHGFPAGAVLMTDWGITPHRWFRDGRKHKSSSLARLMEDLPQVTWVLVGDDGEHDPHLYGDLAEAHPDRVAAIALRHVRPTAPARTGREEGSGATDGVPILRGVDGDELLPLLRDALNRRPSAT